MALTGPEPAQMRRLRFHFRTRYRWIDGEIVTPSRRLIDVINRDDLDDGLIADSVRTYDIHQSGNQRDHVTVNLQNILFAMPIEEPGAPPPGDPYAKVRKEPVQLELGIGPFILTGNVFLVDVSNPRHVASQLRSRFFAMASVVMRNVDLPDFLEEHPVVFVNRAMIDYTLPVIPPLVAPVAEVAEEETIADVPPVADQEDESDVRKVEELKASPA